MNDYWTCFLAPPKMAIKQDNFAVSMRYRVGREAPMARGLIINVWRDPIEPLLVAHVGGELVTQVGGAGIAPAIVAPCSRYR